MMSFTNGGIGHKLPQQDKLSRSKNLTPVHPRSKDPRLQIAHGIMATGSNSVYTQKTVANSLSSIPAELLSSMPVLTAHDVESEISACRPEVLLLMDSDCSLGGALYSGPEKGLTLAGAKKFRTVYSLVERKIKTFKDLNIKVVFAMSQSTYDFIKNECKKIPSDSSRSVFGKLDATIKKAVAEDRILIPCLVNKQEEAYSVALLQSALELNAVLLTTRTFEEVWKRLTESGVEESKEEVKRNLRLVGYNFVQGFCWLSLDTLRGQKVDDVIRDHSAKSFVETSDKGFLHQIIKTDMSGGV